ncbi:hypothetical protein K438DRAFT_1941271 [Mycena galopus ATCC 62051]|nr:hypothetical protein K438DRAFT_1941271 [Mycena galopus ATCC 62051]
MPLATMRTRSPRNHASSALDTESALGTGTRSRGQARSSNSSALAGARRACHRESLDAVSRTERALEYCACLQSSYEHTDLYIVHAHPPHRATPVDVPMPDISIQSRRAAIRRSLSTAGSRNGLQWVHQVAMCAASCPVSRSESIQACFIQFFPPTSVPRTATTHVSLENEMKKSCLRAEKSKLEEKTQSLWNLRDRRRDNKHILELVGNEGRNACLKNENEVSSREVRSAPLCNKEQVGTSSAGNGADSGEMNPNI